MRRARGARGAHRLRGRFQAVLAASVLLVPACAPQSPLPALAPVVAERDGAYGLRDPRAGLPAPPLSERDEEALVRSLADLRAGRVAEARQRIEPRLGRTRAPLAFELLLVYAGLVGGDSGRDPDEALRTLAATHPAWLAAVEARADHLLARQQLREAWDAYRAAVRLAPRDQRLVQRTEVVRLQLVAARQQDGQVAVAAGDLDGARKAALSLLELDPGSLAASMLLARIAEAGSRFEDAYAMAHDVRARIPADASWTELTARLAQKTGRYLVAAELYDELARKDAGFAGRAEEVRLDFRIQNLPEAARKAAQSARLTRAQLATLAWWTVPEVRGAQLAGTAEVAVDVVDRPDRTALTRAIALGLLTVSRDTHRVGVDVPVGRTELAVALRQVARLAGRGRPPGGCLAAEVPSPAALVECGILGDAGSRVLTGREGLRAIERAARLGREGVTR